MKLKTLTENEKEAIKILESLQKFIQTKHENELPIFTDELCSIWGQLEEAMANIETA